MNKRSRFFIFAALFLLLILIIIAPKVYIDGAMQGFDLFLYKVFPSLFPFFIITRLLTMLGIGNHISKVLSKPLKYAYNSHPIGGYILLLSMISGYPIGAKLVSEYVKVGIIDVDDAKTIIPYTSTSGPMFILGVIGTQILGDYKAAVFVLISHFLAALINGVVFRRSTNSGLLIDFNEETTNSSFFNDAIQQSIISIAQVGANIIIMNVFLIALSKLGIINLIAKGISAFGIEIDFSLGIAYAMFEMTQGVNLISQSVDKIKDIIVALSVIISFGGVSIIMQSMIFLSKIGIKASYFIVTKISHAIIAYIVASLLVLLY